MNPLRKITGILVATIVLVPAVAPAATTADLQAQTITILRQIVEVQQQLIAVLQAQIAQLQAEVYSLTGNSSYSQLWPLEQALVATGTPPAVPPIPAPSPLSSIGSKQQSQTTSSCSYQGLTYPSGTTANGLSPDRLCGLGFPAPEWCASAIIVTPTYQCINGVWQCVRLCSR